MCGWRQLKKSELISTSFKIHFNNKNVFFYLLVLSIKVVTRQFFKLLALLSSTTKVIIINYLHLLFFLGSRRKDTHFRDCELKVTVLNVKYVTQILSRKVLIRFRDFGERPTKCIKLCHVFLV